MLSFGCLHSVCVLCKPDTWWLKCASAAIVLQLMAYSSCPFLSFKIENQSLGIIQLLLLCGCKREDIKKKSSYVWRVTTTSKCQLVNVSYVRARSHQASLGELSRQVKTYTSEFLFSFVWPVCFFNVCRQQRASMDLRGLIFQSRERFILKTCILCSQD